MGKDTQKEGQFKTENLGLACFLYATNKLKFIGCEYEPGRSLVGFVFDDPKEEGESLRIEFEAGGEVPAATFMDTLRHLRRIMDDCRRGVMFNAQHRGGSSDRNTNRSGTSARQGSIW
jgi:hypothetical protein